MSKWNCPNCGGHKKPWYDYCYICHKQKNSDNPTIAVFFILFVVGVSILNWDKYLKILTILGKILLILAVAIILYWIFFRRK